MGEGQSPEKISTSIQRAPNLLRQITHLESRYEAKGWRVEKNLQDALDFVSSSNNNNKQIILDIGGDGNRSLNYQGRCISVALEPSQGFQGFGPPILRIPNCPPDKRNNAVFVFGNIVNLLADFGGKTFPENVKVELTCLNKESVLPQKYIKDNVRISYDNPPAVVSKSIQNEIGIIKALVSHLHQAGIIEITEPPDVIDALEENLAKMKNKDFDLIHVLLSLDEVRKRSSYTSALISNTGPGTGKAHCLQIRKK